MFSSEIVRNSKERENKNKRPFFRINFELCNFVKRSYIFGGDLVVRWGCERKIKDENQKLRHTVTSHTRVMT